ncbi:MAG: HD domain-containing protein [Bacilli bacterium]|nr:HD domain-containing protein [Bacilli bacterium]
MNFENAVKEYISYAKTYDLTNPELMSEFHHTHRVVDYAKDIAISEGLSNEDVDLAKLCALLHDIARYKQQTDYKTYLDIRSFDHGDEAVNILKKNNYIDKYTTDKESQNIIFKAIKNHNKLKIENGLSEREELFAKILRDADKLDKMKEKGNTINGVIVLNVDYIKPFKERRLYQNHGVTGEYEVTLRLLAFVYDMNFKYSYEFVLNNNIIQDKIRLIMGHSNSIAILEYVEKLLLEYVNERIEELSK